MSISRPPLAGRGRRLLPPSRYFEFRREHGVVVTPGAQARAASPVSHVVWLRKLDAIVEEADRILWISRHRRGCR